MLVGLAHRSSALRNRISSMLSQASGYRWMLNELGTSLRTARRDAPFASALAICGIWLAIRYYQTTHWGWGTGYDVGMYQGYARQWGSGAAPYVSFHPEYPAGALLVFLVPHLFAGAAGYAHYFALEMACFDLLACFLVLRTLELQTRGRIGIALGATALYLAGTAILYPVLYTRFDLVPGALTLVAVYAHARRRYRLSAFWLGVAGAVKLWPFALAPLWILSAWRRGGMAAAMRAAAMQGSPMWDGSKWVTRK